jgi:hypothetical protein
MQQTEISLPCDMSEDATIFWLDDGHMFSRVESKHESGTGNRHYLSDIIELRNWLDAAIKELEGEKP